MMRCTYVPGDSRNDKLPLVCLTVDDAEGLCAREGRRLPTEAEWEWAAGGATAEHLFPWGDAIADIGDDQQQLAAPVDGNNNGVSIDITPQGAHDMSSNVFEATADTFDRYTGPCWLPGSYGPDPKCTPERAADGALRSFRGGAYGYDTGLRTAVSRQAYDPHNLLLEGGFRCARDDH
jgi:formylglycine-generating enzyme required for sulfatase activity